MNKDILWYNELTKKDVNLVGGKNASLGEMIKNLSYRKINNEKTALNLISQAIKKSNYILGKDINFSIDIAANSFYSNNKYSFQNKNISSIELINYYKKLIKDYPIVSLEDPLEENDLSAWKQITKDLNNALIVGDDLFSTNPKYLKQGIKQKQANSILIKPNQIGTISNTIETIHLAQKNNFKHIISHRSGETMDTLISDLAYATGAYGLKAGSPFQAPNIKNDVRRAKYQRLIDIQNKDKKGPVCLIILDGFGINKHKKGNAILNAKTPFYNKLLTNYPNTSLYASGSQIGLDSTAFGHSEIGHTIIGAGRLEKPIDIKITEDINKGFFYHNHKLVQLLQKAKKENKKVHLIGLISKKTVHADFEHLKALLLSCKKNKINNVFVHGITDGRDSDTRDAINMVKETNKITKILNTGTLATLCGRYYAMDRDKNWSRTKQAYDLYTDNKGNYTENIFKTLDDFYNENKSDEFLPPTVLNKEGQINHNDIVIFFNHRQDRARQIVLPFIDLNFKNFTKNKNIITDVITLTDYFNSNVKFKNLTTLYKKPKLKNHLTEVLSKNNIKQLKITETEKYGPLTYYFNGGNEDIYSLEDRIIIDSPKEVKTYDQKPEMSSYKIKDKLLEKLGSYNFITVNFPSPDMVGHTGDFNAAIKAIEHLDNCLKEIIEAGKKYGYTFLITADHGNCEEMIDQKTKRPLTSHTLNKVPLIIVDTVNKYEDIKLKKQKTLADIAPSILNLLNIPIPKEMNSSMLELAKHKQKISKYNPYIAKIEAKETLNSRNEKTIKARIILKDGFKSDFVSIPSGKSKSEKEVPTISTTQALENIKLISTSFNKRKIKVLNQKQIDRILNKHINIYGGNTTLAVSLACLKCASQILNLEPYEYIRKTYPETSKEYNTHLLFNIFNGGLHATKHNQILGEDKIHFQELMLNIQEETYAKALEKADNIYFNLKEVLKIHNYDHTTFGDEGGYSPNKIQNINFPNGFATTSIAFEAYLKEANIYQTIKTKLKKLNTNNLKDLKKTGKEIRELILKTPLPKELKFNLTKNYELLSTQYNSKHIDVAIRSSATAEDSKDNSFAGMHESYLNVSSNKELINKTKHAFASLFTDRAIDYRRKKGFQDMEVTLSIGIQKMVRSDKAVSGVMFTCDPETGFDDIIFINASYGLGENIVKGKVNADQILVSKHALKNGYYPIIEKNIGLKQETLIYSTKSDTKNIKTPKEKQNKLCLTDNEIIKLAKWGMYIEEHYNCKMDIEWAKDGNDKKLYIVQARPETVFANQDKNKLITYSIKEKNKDLILEGLSVGTKVATGKVQKIKNIKDIAKFKKGNILVTKMTDPDWVPVMKQASGIITEQGSRTCHAAIVGRELQIPTIVACQNALNILKENQSITLSCAQGEIGKVYNDILTIQTTETQINNSKKLPVKVKLNLGNPEIAFQYSKLPNDGVGLVREEFIIANYIKIHPLALLNYKLLDKETKNQINEITKGNNNKDYYIDKLSSGIAKIACAFNPKEIIIRFSDFKTNEYRNLIGGEYFENEEENPMIGFRGARRYYDPEFKPAFILECQAIKKAIDYYGFKNISVMVPFCRTPKEARKVLQILEEQGLTSEKLKRYVMCELPSNIILADRFLDLFDGMSIGSNDLTQLTLGIDRDNGLLKIDDERNEAILKQISDIILKCKQRNKYIGICGDAPSTFKDFMKFLVLNKIDSISLSPDAILKTIQELNKF